MHTPDSHGHHRNPEHDSHVEPGHKPSIEEGYEVTDVDTRGIMVFLAGLFICVGVFFVFCFGMGILINNGLKKHDGPLDKWNASADTSAGKLKNMESNPAGEQQELQHLTQKFPTPRLQIDDGNQDIANLHEREALLLDHYSWIDRSQGKVRIPIDRAMDLIAQRGLPVASQPATTEPLMYGDAKPVVQVPLTDGFAPTAFEQEERSAKLAGEQASTKANNN